jgi:hypothetical protein
MAPIKKARIGNRVAKHGTDGGIAAAVVTIGAWFAEIAGLPEPPAIVIASMTVVVGFVIATILELISPVDRRETDSL